MFLRKLLKYNLVSIMIKFTSINSLEGSTPKTIKPQKNKSLPMPKDHGLSLAVLKVVINELQMIKVIKADVSTVNQKN